MTNHASKKLKNLRTASGSPLGLLPHQLEAVDLALKRLENHRAVYLGLDPGLGKTVVAAALRHVVPGRIVYITPPGLASNVKAILSLWAKDLEIEVVPDNRLDKVASLKTDLLIVDEAQRFNNQGSIRTNALFRLAKGARRIVFMSGSPAPNSRPIELWPILETFAPDVFDMSFFSFAKKFCAAEQVVIGWDPVKKAKKLRWKFDGKSNMKEFRERLYSSFMIRMRKDRVKLPPKIESLLTVGDNISPTIAKLEKKIIDRMDREDVDDAKAWLSALSGVEELHQSKYLKLLGEHKLQYFTPIIDTLLSETKEKILIFAVHTDTIASLVKHLHQYKPMVLTGKTKMKDRPGEVARFQTDPKCRVGVLNIQAGGIGWTLTEADRIIMLEYSWKDGDNQQAGDRASRIGSKKPLLVEYVVLKDSIDAQRMGVLINKRLDAV